MAIFGHGQTQFLNHLLLFRLESGMFERYEWLLYLVVGMILGVASAFAFRSAEMAPRAQTRIVAPASITVNPPPELTQPVVNQE